MEWDKFWRWRRAGEGGEEAQEETRVTKIRGLWLG